MFVFLKFLYGGKISKFFFFRINLYVRKCIYWLVIFYMYVNECFK